ncbi:hypothetical protein FXO37_12311 [Capsicum annuum]|nr:hypothetical protein FXO37_12311 [Capsicum annuum]
MMTQLDLLTKYVIGEPMKEVNFVASKAYDEEAKTLNDEIWYLANYSGGSRLAYQSQDGNQGWMDLEHNSDWRDNDCDDDRYVPPYDWEKNKDGSTIDLN